MLIQIKETTQINIKTKKNKKMHMKTSENTIQTRGTCHKENKKNLRKLKEIYIDADPTYKARQVQKHLRKVAGKIQGGYG